MANAPELARALLEAQLAEGPGSMGPATSEVIRQFGEVGNSSELTIGDKIQFMGRVAGYLATVAAKVVKEAEAQGVAITLD